MKFLQDVDEQERGYSMPVDNFGFAQIPNMPNTGSYSLKEVGMLASTIENIDRSLVEYIRLKRIKTSATPEDPLSCHLLASNELRL